MEANDMAKMFPNRVNDYEFESNEDIAFDKLEKLPKDYYIFHFVGFIC